MIGFARGVLLVALGISAAGTAVQPSDRAIESNDNRAPAGTLGNGTLQIHLEIARGAWHPGSGGADAVSVFAFGEAGKPLQVPGPMIRVPLGTTIAATVHNSLPIDVFVHGLNARAANADSGFRLAVDETRVVTFAADAVGSFYYWAAATNGPITTRRRDDSQLHGALIVDPSGAKPADRVFVISLWDDDPLIFSGVAAINGKQWPYTERMALNVGETVRWRVINPTMDSHAMHLHGSFFHVDAIGDDKQEQALDEASRLTVVTYRVPAGGTFDMSWTAPRRGRWLFHCHMVPHMTASSNAHEHATDGGPDAAGMGGLVIGITVDGPPDANTAAATPARKLQLLIDERKESHPRYQIQLRDPAKQPATADPAAATESLLGPPIFLTQGEATEITVQNRTTEPTAIHWHGIELESYYDGVPGWTGSGSQVTPPIAPGESFAARMTPPRAGTFIYHTHWHDEKQLDEGLYGPLIVLPPGKSFDADTDKIFVFSAGAFEPFGRFLLINGYPQPRALRLPAGRTYRFRLIQISAGFPSMRASLTQAGKPVEWRAIAKDGADLPASQMMMKSASTVIAPGETYDFEYDAKVPQELTLELYLPGPKRGISQTIVFTAPGR